MFQSGQWLLTSGGLALALGVIAWVVFRFHRTAERAGLAERLRAEIVDRLARGEPLEEMLSLLTRSLEESSSRIRCAIVLTAPIYSAEDDPIEESQGSLFPIVDSSGARVGLLTIQPATARLTPEEAKAVDNIRHLAAIIAEHRSTHTELQLLARRDRLTGLANGLVFAEALGRLFETAALRKPMALFVFDLDRFQQVNDRLGRGAGDSYLREVAERIGKCFRSGDLLARLGAGDFAALAPGLTAAEAERICQSVIDAFSAPFAIEGLRIVGSVSIGVTSFPQGGTSPAELRFSADAALEDAKKKGGGRFTICTTDIRECATSLVNAGRLIRQALDDNGFDLFYQPQMRISGGLSGMEALVRRRHPEEGPIAAATFIEVAEHPRLIDEIGAWVLPEAMRQYAEWLRKGLNPVRIAVNISRLDVPEADIFKRVISSLKTFGLGPEVIQIELTESASALSDETIEVLHELRSAGISVALDAFGRGSSPLRCLHGLPVNAIKIDKSFVSRLTEPDGSTPQVSAMIAAAHALRMTVIAEGVETEGQMWALRRLGCEVLQGDHIARPLNAASAGQALAERLKTQRPSRQY